MVDGRWREEGRQGRDGWRKGPDGRVSYVNKEGFLIIIKKGSHFNKKDFFFKTETMSSTLIFVERHQLRTFGPTTWI